MSQGLIFLVFNLDFGIYFRSFIFFYKDKIKLKLSKIQKYGIYLIIFLFAIYFNENTKHPSFLTLFFLIFVSLLILNIEKQKISIIENL